MLTKEEILKKCELRSEVVNVPELGGDIRVRELRADEHDQYQNLIYTLKGEDVIINRDIMTTSLLSFCIVNDDMEPMFVRDELSGMPARIAKRLFKVAQELNGETPEEQDEIEKN